jgi:hypothetical protein
MLTPLSKTRVANALMQWVLYAGLVAPWGVILAWLGSGLARQ